MVRHPKADQVLVAGDAFPSEPELAAGPEEETRCCPARADHPEQEQQNQKPSRPPERGQQQKAAPAHPRASGNQSRWYRE